MESLLGLLPGQWVLLGELGSKVGDNLLLTLQGSQLIRTAVTLWEFVGEDRLEVFKKVVRDIGNNH